MVGAVVGGTIFIISTTLCHFETKDFAYGCTKLHMAPRADQTTGTSRATPQKLTFAIASDPESEEREASSAVKASPERTVQI